MSGTLITLRSFDEADLIFDDTETRDILKFFFAHLAQRIEAAPLTTSLRSFAQGLLIEAIDATYALGYIEILLRTSYNPGSGMRKALLKIGRKAAQHWFKHAAQKDLLNAKISSRVRDRLAVNFKTHFQLMLDGVASSRRDRQPAFAYIQYGQPSKLDAMWG